MDGLAVGSSVTSVKPQVVISGMRHFTICDQKVSQFRGEALALEIPASLCGLKNDKAICQYSSSSSSSRNQGQFLPPLSEQYPSDQHVAHCTHTQCTEGHRGSMHVGCMPEFNVAWLEQRERVYMHLLGSE